MEEHSPTQLASPAFDALRCPSDALLYIVGASYGTTWEQQDALYQVLAELGIENETAEMMAEDPSEE